MSIEATQLLQRAETTRNGSPTKPKIDENLASLDIFSSDPTRTARCPRVPAQASRDPVSLLPVSRHRAFEFTSYGRRYSIGRYEAHEPLQAREAERIIAAQLRGDALFRSSLARWLTWEGLVHEPFGDDRRTLDELLRYVRSGTIRLYQLPAPPPGAYSHTRADVGEPAAPLPPLISDDEIEEDTRALLITHCPPQFDPRVEPLKIAYSLRDLQGRPVELVIRSQAKPEPPLHRRPLTSAETNDGAGKLEWDGVDENVGELVERPLAPFVVELVHDATYRDEATTTLPPPPQAHFLEMEDLVFSTDREILLPQSLGALIVLVEFAREHPEKRILVAGHTDTVGSDAHNTELSERRAQNVQLWLCGDVEGWAAHCQENFEIADFKAVHLWAHEHLGWSTNPGELDNEWHSKARVARDVFRSQCESLLEIELEHHVAQNEADWRAIHDLYSLIVSRYLDLEPESLLELRRTFTFTDPSVLGCGEAFPRERAGEDNVASSTNRRVEVLFFDPDEDPELSAEPKGVKIYGEQQYQFEELHPRHLDPLTPTIFEIDICLVDHWHRNALGNVAYSLSGPLPERLLHREGTTDPEGVLTEDTLPSGYYELCIGETTLIVMAHPVGFSDPGHPQVGPNFRDVYRVARHGMAPVFPDLPDAGLAEDWTVPAYVPGPDREVGSADEDEPETDLDGE